MANSKRSVGAMFFFHIGVQLLLWLSSAPDIVVFSEEKPTHPFYSLLYYTLPKKKV